MPVSSNKLGVIPRLRGDGEKTEETQQRRGTVTHPENEPPSGIDTVGWLRTIGKARGKVMLGIPGDAESGEQGDGEQWGKHWRSWHMVKESGGEREREREEREK